MPDNEPNGTPAAADQQAQRADGTTTVPANDAASGDAQQPNGSGSQEPVRDPVAKAIADAEAKYRTQLRQAEKRIADFEAQQKAAEEAKLSELEKWQKRHAELQTSSAEKERQFQERIIRSEVRAQAAALGINADLAAKIVDYAAIEYNEVGDPQNIAALLGSAISTYGLNATPAASQQPSAPPQPTSVGTNPGNPARSGANGTTSGALSREYIESLSPEQYAALPGERRAEILNWLAANPRR